MKFKLNWGQGIFIFYLFFTCTLIFVLFQSMQVKHNLVVDDYYKEDLAYQSQIDKIKNQKLSNNLIVKTSKKDNKITFNFLDAESLKGQIHFYRPSDKNKDFKIDINENNFSYDTQKMIKGKWTLKIDWQDKSNNYYHEKEISI
ncbi:MAG: hypothetical protein HKO66_16865 [Saprospiraceae bacterium]|nr:FixH family protein [Bacteroidia bacterium]NNE14685.1 hypothetical protein [Saprospiraceae bacterium]NNL93918.1 hypothetical protein [Saprospiraceae bacterium]